MLLTIFLIAVLIMSAVVHEVAHGYAAFRLGDNTAKDLGRLTLNPLKHLDPFGSVILPLILAFTPGIGFFIAWAKPVPFNPYQLKDIQNDPVKVALAGPFANLGIIIVFGILASILPMSQETQLYLINSYMGGDNTAVMMAMSGSLINSVYVMSFIICLLNCFLFVFNLIPIPPLDGSKLLLRVLPANAQEFVYKYENYGFFLIIFLVWFGLLDRVLWPVIAGIMGLFF